MKKKRKILRFVPILPGLLDRRRDARARRRQGQQQQEKKQQEEEQTHGRIDGSQNSQRQQQQRRQQQQQLLPPRAAAAPTFGEQLPISEDLEDDPALPFGATLRSADDVPMSLVVRSRCDFFCS